MLKMLKSVSHTAQYGVPLWDLTLFALTDGLRLDEMVEGVEDWWLARTSGIHIVLMQKVLFDANVVLGRLIGTPTPP